MKTIWKKAIDFLSDKILRPGFIFNCEYIHGVIGICLVDHGMNEQSYNPIDVSDAKFIKLPKYPDFLRKMFRDRVFSDYNKVELDNIESSKRL